MNIAVTTVIPNVAFHISDYVLSNGLPSLSLQPIFIKFLWIILICKLKNIKLSLNFISLIIERIYPFIFKHYCLIKIIIMKNNID